MTERERAEETLKLSEQRYALAQMAGGVISWECDLETDEMKCSADPDSMLGKPCSTFGERLEWANSEDREALKKAANDTLRTGKCDVEHRVANRKEKLGN